MNGIRTDMPKHLIPDGYLSGGENVLFRDGLIVVRGGMTPLTSTAPTTVPIMGGIFYSDHVQTLRTIAGTTTGFWLFSSGAWSDISGSALTGTNADQVRFTVFPLTNTTRVIAVNDVNAPRVYTGAGNFVSLGGSPPIAMDCTTAFRRVILGNIIVSGTRRSTSVAVSGFQDPTIWSSDNFFTIADTGDPILAVKNLDDQQFAIYREKSQWVGIGAGDIFPFIYEIRDQQPGPVSPAAVVQAEGPHYYVGLDGDVYRFDGNRCTSIGYPVRRLIQSDFDFDNRKRCHGVYDPINREIWWYWQSYRTIGGFSGIAYRLPNAEMPGAFSPLMTYRFSLTASLQWRDTIGLGWDDLTGTWDDLGALYPTWDSFPNVSRLGILVGSSAGQVYRFGRSGGDDGGGIDASWDLPFRSYGGVGENVRMDSIEAHFKKPALSVNASIVLLTTDTLNDDGTVADTQTFDINTSNKIRATYYNQVARFMSIRHKLTGTQGLQEYRGGTIYAYSRGES